MTKEDLEKVSQSAPWENLEWFLDKSNRNPKVCVEKIFLMVQKELLKTVGCKVDNEKLDIFNFVHLNRIQHTRFHELISDFKDVVRYSTTMTMAFICREYPEYLDLCKEYFEEQHDYSYHLFMKEACGVHID